MSAIVPKSLSLCCVAIVLAAISMTAAADDNFPTTDEIRAAIDKSLPLLEKGARGSIEQRKQCFNCHNQGLPIMAFVTARSRGIPIDDEHLQQQVQFTADFLKRNQDRYKQGDGQGGQVDTAGYALWALDHGGWKQDEITAAVAEYLLIRQNDLEHYKPESIRPPSERSHFTSTYVALRGLKVYGLPDQQERIQARIAKVREWLLKTPPEETEDRVFRLRALPLVDAPNETIRQAADELRTQQREDGGWSQLPDLQSDSYATGSVLAALNEMGGLATDDPCYRKALRYLISIQQPDGSWYVASRSKPFQTYFESGYPHGKDQFISMSAASWATTALTLALPKVEQVTATP